MTPIVYVNRLNPKTTEQDFKRFCTRFGNVIECVIFPENDKLSKRSGYVKFASHQSAEKMYRESRSEILYIDQTSIEVELRPENSRLLNEKKNLSSSSMIYTLDIQGQITDENELIHDLNSKPLSIKLLETGAQVTYNDKDLVDRILQENHEKYTIKLLPPIKRELEQEQSLEVKRSKFSSNSYLTLTSHLENITKLTRDMYEENERLKNDKSLLTIALNQQVTKNKQIELEKSELIQSFSKTHDITKCLTNKFKLREDEHKRTLDELNKKLLEYELIIKTTNDALLTAKNEIQHLTVQYDELNKKYIQSESEYFVDIEHFFSALKKTSN